MSGHLESFDGVLVSNGLSLGAEERNHSATWRETLDL